MASTSREGARKAFAALLDTALVDTNIVEAVYDYQVGDFDGKASTVVVTSGGIMRVQQSFGTCWHNTYRLDCYLFVLYADPDSNWTEADAEDKIDDIEAAFADVVMSGTNDAWNGTPEYAEQTALGVVQVGGVSYRRELISILLEKTE